MASPTLAEFMREVGPRARDAGATDRELRQYWASTHGAEHLDRASLPTWEDFHPSIQRQQPDLPEEDIRSYWEEHYGDFGAREKDQGDVGRGFGTAFKQLPQLASGLEAGAGAVGETIFGEGGLFTALKEHGLRNYQEIEQEIAQESKPSDSISEAYRMARAGNPGALVDWLQHGLGYAGGQAIQMLATAGIGAIGGKLALNPAVSALVPKLVAKESLKIGATESGAKLTADQLAKQAVSNVAGRIGQTAALAAAATGMEGGEIFGGLVEKAAEEGRSLTGAELAKAVGYTALSGGAEFVGDKFTVDILLGRSVANRLAKSRIGNTLIGGLTGFAVEGLTEATQTPLEQLGKGQDPRAPGALQETIDAAALGALGGTAIGTTGGFLTRPKDQTVLTDTERQPEDLGLTPDVLSPQYGAGSALDVSPVPDVSPVTAASTLDKAIARAVGVVQGATETAKARAAEFAKMTAKAKNETDALLARAQQERAGTDIPILSGPVHAAPSLLDQPSPIVLGQAFTPRPQPEPDPQQWLAEERARLVAERDRRRTEQPISPPISPPISELDATPGDDTLPSRLDLAYPTSKQVRDLIHQKGFHLDTPVFQQFLKGAVGKERFTDLTPQELQRLKDRVDALAPDQQGPTPSVPVSPTKERPSAPVTTIPEARVPRSELPPEKNAEILLRAEKAKADMEIAGTERGGRFFQEQQGAGSTQEVVGLKSATADWYKALTSGPSQAIRGDRKQSAREKIEDAIAKIIQDEGADRGKAVEQVKAALLHDHEFHQTEWGRDLNSILQGEWPSWVEKPAQPSGNSGALQAADNAETFKNVPRGTPHVTGGEPKPIEVPLSRTERLQRQKQKMEAKKAQDPINALIARYMESGRSAFRYPRRGTISVDGREMQQRDAIAKIQAVLNRDVKQSEMSPSEAPRVEPQSAIASPERAPAPPIQEAAPKPEEPFSLTAPEPSTPKAKETGPEQLRIDVPPPTIGERPIIGREATLDEAPLFSKNAQEPDAEQVALPEETEKPESFGASRDALTPDDIVQWKSPFSGAITEASYRGELNGKAVLWTGKTQVSADYKDLRKVEPAQSEPIEKQQSPTDMLAPALRQEVEQSAALTLDKIPADLQITLSVEVEQTGETREVEVNARKVWKQAKQKVARLTKLLECVG